jgi:prepilin-type N-terminal cleavage/methylation domain-containing protein
MRHRKQKRAFTIVEVLIALAITAMLLTAVAVAFNASVKNYQENEKMYKTMNNARQAMLRMTAQLRTADVNSVSITSTECTLTAAGGQWITYRYNGTDKKLYLVTNDDLTDSDYVLCDNVTAISFTRTPTDTGLPVQSVQISMTVDIDSQTVSSAAVIRRNLE